jgi:hypothetical protein
VGLVDAMGADVPVFVAAPSEALWYRRRPDDRRPDVPIGARAPWWKVVVLARSSVRRLSPPIADSGPPFGSRLLYGTSFCRVFEPAFWDAADQ